MYMSHAIAFFEIEPWEEEFFRKELSDHTLLFFPAPLEQKDIPSLSEVSIISPFIYSQISPEIVTTLSFLKLVATRSTGYDHIHVEACKEKGVGVANVPTYGEHTVAEQAFALILALSRHLPESVTRTRRGDFSLENLRGFELFGKTIGLVGYGTIAKVVAKIALGFGMKVIVYTRHPEPYDGVTFVDLPTLLATSDIISLHVPYNKNTHHMINKDNIALCKKGSVFINTARGGVVEAEALVWALEQGILSAVGLDVLEEECTLKEERQLLSKEFLKSCNLKTQLLNHVLINRDNVIVTPHNAFNSQEALQRILDVTLENIRMFIDKGVPSHLVFV
jgi:D-lactate dehydrogenase